MVHLQQEKSDAGGERCVSPPAEGFAMASSTHHPSVWPDASQAAASAGAAALPEVKIDAVDAELDKESGLVERKRDKLLYVQFLSLLFLFWLGSAARLSTLGPSVVHSPRCRHGSGNRCINCTPLQPWDEAVLGRHDPPIKFMSFHTYLRKLHSGADQCVVLGRQLSEFCFTLTPPLCSFSFPFPYLPFPFPLPSSSLSPTFSGRLSVLQDLQCKILPGCTSHAPWPKVSGGGEVKSCP